MGRINIRSFLTWHLGQRTLLRSIFSKNIGPKNHRNIVEKYFPRKGPKSISLDSGHLDRPFGPLIFQFFKYVWTLFSINFWTNFAYFPGLGCSLIWLLLDPVWAGPYLLLFSL